MQKRLVRLLATAMLTLLALPAAAEVATLKLDDFAYGADLTPAESEFRRVELTPMMIKHIQRRDLGDVRVFDGKNSLMHSLVKKKVSKVKTSKHTPGISPFKVSGVTRGYILDRMANHGESLKSLQLHWRSGKAPNVLSVKVEHSADRKNWKILKDAEIVSNFKLGGRILNQNFVDINNFTERYIRLTFPDAKQAPVLASVTAYITNRKLSDYVWIPAGQLQPYNDMPDTFTAGLGKGVTPDLFKLIFSNLNSLLSGSLYSMETVDGKEKRILIEKNFDAYSVSRNLKVIKSRPVDVSRWPSSQWLVTTRSTVNIPEQDMPGVMLAYPQYEVIFAHEGVEPYTVVWGNSSSGEPAPGDLVKRIKAEKLSWDDIDVVKTGIVLDKTQLTELWKSRQTPWVMIIVLLVIVMAALMFIYRRYRL